MPGGGLEGNTAGSGGGRLGVDYTPALVPSFSTQLLYPALGPIFDALCPAADLSTQTIRVIGIWNVSAQTFEGGGGRG